jgi:phage terminase Nu1 subunit (DNA packaging protein)
MAEQKTLEQKQAELEEQAQHVRLRNDQIILAKASKGEKLDAQQTKRFYELTAESDDREVTLETLAKWSGIKRELLITYAHKGVVIKGEQNRYPLQTNIIRLIRMVGAAKDLPTVDAEIKRNQARLSHAKATMQEMKMMQASLKLVPASIVQRINDRHWSSIRAQIDGIPSNAAKEANHLDPLQAELAIEKALQEVLKQGEKSLDTIASEISEMAAQEMEALWREVAEDAKKEFSEAEENEEEETAKILKPKSK